MAHLDFDSDDSDADDEAGAQDDRGEDSSDGDNPFGPGNDNPFAPDDTYNTWKRLSEFTSNGIDVDNFEYAQATEADKVGYLIHFLRKNRDAALEGYSSWDEAVEYCRRLTRLCDENFCIGESEKPRFPALIVAMVYAECGRTLALSGNVRGAQDMLKKALYLFGIAPVTGDEAWRQHHEALALASLARVHRRSGRPADSLNAYLKALGTFAALTDEESIVQVALLISEYSEAVGEAGPENFSSSGPPLVYELAEAKLGDQSDVYLRAVEELSEACLSVGQRRIAAPALGAKAKLLRQDLRGEVKLSSARHVPESMRLAEVETAEEEAAAAWEEAAGSCIEQGDVQNAVVAWTEALSFRELVGETNGDLLLSMRTALTALKQAAGIAKEKVDDGLAEETKVSSNGNIPTTEQSAMDPAFESDHQQPVPASVSLTKTSLSLRPSWAR